MTSIGSNFNHIFYVAEKRRHGCYLGGTQFKSFRSSAENYLNFLSCGWKFDPAFHRTSRLLEVINNWYLIVTHGNAFFGLKVAFRAEEMHQFSFHAVESMETVFIELARLKRAFCVLTHKGRLLGWKLVKSILQSWKYKALFVFAF